MVRSYISAIYHSTFLSISYYPATLTILKAHNKLFLYFQNNNKERVKHMTSYNKTTFVKAGFTFQKRYVLHLF